MDTMEATKTHMLIPRQVSVDWVLLLSLEIHN